MALQYRAELEGRPDDIHGGWPAIYRHGGGFDDHGFRPGGCASNPTGTPGGRSAPVRAESGIAEILGTDRTGCEARKDRGRIRIHRRARVGPEGIPVCQRRGKNKLSRVYPDGRVETLLEIGDPDGSTLDAKGRLVTTASVLRAIIQVDPDGKYKVLADKFEGKKFNSPNDVILGPDGALYFTDPTLDLPKGEKQELRTRACSALAPTDRSGS